MIGAVLASPWTCWGIAGLATAGVIIRPFSWPEFIWAVSGAVLLVALGVLSPSEALSGVAKGTDVYLFLTGMMLLSELARQEGLFDWLAARAARLAKGSATRLFTLVFAVGTVVTVFLSNDATAVVLTPAVAAAAKAAKAEKPLPYLFICAFIANAASFVLPISNPANLVIYGSHIPLLLQWLPRYALPSLLSILATYAVLRWTQSGDLRQEISADIEVPPLSAAGKMAAFGIMTTAVVLLVSSGFDIQLGLPTFLAGLGTAILVLTRSKCGVADIANNISWGVCCRSWPACSCWSSRCKKPASRGCFARCCNTWFSNRRASPPGRRGWCSPSAATWSTTCRPAWSRASSSRQPTCLITCAARC